MTSPAASTTSDGTLAERAQALLTDLAGPDARLRDDQLAAVEALVRDRRRALVVQRTGWGKSAVYWIATALLRADGAGPTLVVSPLLALMRDQVAAARRMGVRAETLNSSNAGDWSAVEELLVADEVDVLLVSPERLNAAGFRTRVLAGLAGRLGLLVVDEAHCVSDWGHDFRPDYRRLVTLVEALPARTPVLATTATANERVTADVAAQLGDDTLTLRGTLDRESLALSVLRPGSAGATASTADRYAWLAGWLAETKGSGIVYCLTVAETTRLASFLTAQGLAVAAYSGGTDADERERVEAGLRDGTLRAVVATSALGMGYDKPDLAFVVHLGMPSSPIAYYQQVGRAGRAIDRAEAVLLPGGEDAAIWAYFDSTAFPTEERVREVLAALDDAGSALSLPAIEAKVNLRRGRLEALLKVLDVEGAVERAGSSWRSTGREWRYDTERIAGVREARRAEQDAMREYARGERCLMAFLREQLDDPVDEPCGRCQVCLGQAQSDAVDPELRRAAVLHLRARDVVLEPRRQWPSGLPSHRGRLSGLATEPGRALALGDDAGWGAEVRAALATDGPVSDEVLDGVVKLLGRWRGEWSARPEWVCAVPSRGRPVLLGSLAARVGEIGRLPVVEALGRSADTPPQTRMENSARQAANAIAGLRGPDGPLPAGPVLLVDDTVQSGWTMAVAGALLRAAGSGPVLPLALWRRP